MDLPAPDRPTMKASKGETPGLFASRTGATRPQPTMPISALTVAGQPITLGQRSSSEAASSAGGGAPSTSRFSLAAAMWAGARKLRMPSGEVPLWSTKLRPSQAKP